MTCVYYPVPPLPSGVIARMIQLVSEASIRRNTVQTSFNRREESPRDRRVVSGNQDFNIVRGFICFVYYRAHVLLSESTYILTRRKHMPNSEVHLLTSIAKRVSFGIIFSVLYFDKSCEYTSNCGLLILQCSPAWSSMPLSSCMSTI